MRIITMLLLALVATPVHAADVPHVFAAGDVVSAAKINENFTAAAQAAVPEITIRSKGVSYYSDASATSDIVTLTCNAGEQIVGGSCGCFNEATNLATTNAGVLWSCSLAGNGVIGACLAEAITYSPFKNGPPVTVYAVCAATGEAAASLKSMQPGEPQELSAEAVAVAAGMEKMMLELR